MRFLTLAGLAFWLVLGQSACKKGSSVNFPIQSPDDAFLFQVDTLNLQTRTVREDSLRTDELSVQAIGFLNDQKVGKTSSGAFLQFRLPGSFTGFPSGAHVDSVVLTLAYSGTNAYYGDPKQTQQWEVLELNEKLDVNSSYYSNRLFNTTAIPLMTARDLTFDLTSSVHLQLGTDTFTFPPHLRLKMDPALGMRFLNASTAVYKDNDAFQDFFKGVFVRPISAQGSGSIIMFDPLSNYSNLTVFYNDSLKVDLYMNDQTARTSYYTHDYSGSLAQPYVNTVGNFDTTFVVGLSGLKTAINFGTEWMKWVNADQTIAVHEAQVMITTDPSSTAPGYALPNNLLLIAADTNGTNKGIPDQYGQTLYYGGVNKNGVYTFNIARYFQQMVNVYRATNTNIDHGLYVIVPTDNPVTPARLMLDTRKSGYGIRFVVKYSIVK